MPLFDDPYFADEWHLGNAGGLLDLDVQGVWRPIEGRGYTGLGTLVVVIDTGVDYLHPDLVHNYNPSLDYDYDSRTPDAFGDPASDWHGTAVMGIIGADNNGVGTVGVAFDATLTCYRTSTTVSDYWLTNIRDAIHDAAGRACADVANISQGIARDGASAFGSGYAPARFDEIETSIGFAVEQGRGGLGMTIVKSAGNSRDGHYDINADDWTNDTRQVVVAAVDQTGFVSSYSSYGAALLVSAFGAQNEVVTTDRTGAAGYTEFDYNGGFAGTSAATAMVTGIVALIYEANPGLGWRDIQSILAASARHVGSVVNGATLAGSERHAWTWNGADNWNGGGMHFSNDYGYGLVDALAAVRLAETWTVLDPARTSVNQAMASVDVLNTATTIPDGDATGLTFAGVIAANTTIERVTVTLSFSTTCTADMELYLVSPDGTVSQLMADSGDDNRFDGVWTFESQAFRGESSAGLWQVRIVDDAGEDALIVTDVVITTFGDARADDRYVYTDEYLHYAGDANHAQGLIDRDGGMDTVNASAVTTGSLIDLQAGVVGRIAGASFFVAAGTQIENAIGGDGADTLRGNAAANALVGGRGADWLEGRGGSDVLDGGFGADTLIGGAGDDTYIVDNSGDAVREISAADGFDTVRSTISYKLTANVEALILTGPGNTNGTGTALANTLVGNGGSNTLNGAGGADVMIGGAGNDTYIVDNRDDVVRETSASEGVDTVQSSVGIKLTSNVENLILTGAAAINGTGTAFANVIVGNGAANIITGGGGADVLSGGVGADVFVYKFVSDSSISAFDRITDFSSIDRIDLSAVDANTHVAGDQAFCIVDSFTHAAGQMTLDYSASTRLTTILMDVNGDGAADMKIVLNGDREHYTNFIL